MIEVVAVVAMAVIVEVVAIVAVSLICHPSYGTCM
jgi:hypothetical protein